MSNRYEIREQIGKGGLGAVYKALDTQLQREVAIKRVLSPGHATEEEIRDSAAKLIAEAQTLSSLNHPNIVTVFDVGQDEAGGFVVMELLRGETLDETVERGVLTQDDFTEVVYQTMEALIAAQANDVIHRDIKPTNIMVIWQASGKFQLKILDFGLAKFSRTPSVQTMDQEESVMGSIFFMAPEQFERGELDARTDLYQMGCVYYNALTGQYPFGGDTAPQVMNAHLQHKVIPLEKIRPDLSPSICQWVMWLINRDIAHRPTDARDALKQWPRNPEPPGATPVVALPVEEGAKVTSGQVRIVRAGRQASAPPTLIFGNDATGSAPLATRAGTGSTTGRLGRTPGRTGSHTGAIGGGRPNIRKAPTSEEAKRKKFIILGGVGIALLLIIGVTSMKRAKAKNAEARIVELASAKIATGTTADVSLAVKFLSDAKAPGGIKNNAYTVLQKLEGSGISEKIHEELQVANTMALRIRLLQALAERNYTPAVPTMMDSFKSATTDEQRLQILDSVRAIADLNSLPAVLGALNAEHTVPVRKVFEDTVLAVLRKSENTDSAIESILTKVSTASGNERKSLFRILGIIGGEKVKTRLAGIYGDGGDLTYQRDAVNAYYNWQDRSILGEVEKIIQTTGDDALRSAAKRAYINLATLPGPEPVEEMLVIWQKAFELCDNPNDASKLMTFLVQNPDSGIAAMVAKWGSHPSHGALAKSTAGTITKAIASVAELKPGEEMKGNKARIRGDKRASINSTISSLTSWVSPETWFSWSFKAAEAGVYVVEVSQSSLQEAPNQFVVHLAGKTLAGESKMTGALDKFETVRLNSPVQLEAGKIYSLSLAAGARVQPRMMDIGAVRIVKAEQ